MLCFYLILKLISPPSVLLIFVPIDNEMLLISVCTDMTQLVQNCGEEIMINEFSLLDGWLKKGDDIFGSNKGEDIFGN